MIETFKTILEKIEKYNSNISYTITVVNNHYNDGDILATNESSKALAKLSEKFTELTRLLPIYTGTNKIIEEVEDVIIDNNTVSIETMPEGFHITLNALIPKKEKERSSYIRTIMISACKKFANNNFSPIQEPVVIVFKHNYSRPEREWRDHDNLEVNVVVDSLAMYFFEDDNAKNCSHFYFSEKNDKDYTDIFIIKKKCFTGWIANNFNKE